MTATHEEFLELAAASIDFELSNAEREALARHQEGCLACRRMTAGLLADQRAVVGLPRHSLAPAAERRVRAAVGSSKGSSIGPSLRLLGLAAAISLSALAAAVAGADLLRRQADDELAIVPPTVVATPEPGPTGSPAMPTPGPSLPTTIASPAADIPGIFRSGSIVEVVVTSLRVRSAPTVNDARSARLEPLLGTGVQLRIVGGPAQADGYDWYEIEAIGWPHRGWVAAAGRDGAAWIALPEEARSTAPPLSPAEAGLAAILRPDAARSCHSRQADLPPGAIAAVECQLSTALVVRVGVYGFENPRAAEAAYFDRLGRQSVRPATGDCAAGEPGDDAWATDTATGRDAGRIACYRDENGNANVRLTCGAAYIGILGRTGDIADLDRWAWQTAGGELADDGRPGICPPPD